MDDDRKKTVMIIVVIACLALAGGITYWTNRGSGGGRSNRSKLAIVCMNKKCAQKWEMAPDEFQETMRQAGPDMMMAMGPMLFECPHCGKKSATVGNKCQKCEEIFVTDPRKAQNDYPDRCTKCGYSEFEERMKEKK